MGKIILEFDSVEEAVDAQNALDGYKWKMAMWDLDQELRSTTKHGKSVVAYGDKEASDVEVNIAEKYREMIREIVEGYGLNLNN